MHMLNLGEDNVLAKWQAKIGCQRKQMGEKRFITVKYILEYMVR